MVNNKSKPVSQEDPLGCGVACTAFLLEKTYKEAKQLFDAEKVHTYGCDAVDIAYALNVSGLSYRWARYNKEKIPDKSVVFVGRNDYYKDGHYLVRCGDKWMDPWGTTHGFDNIKAIYNDDLHGEVEWIIYPEEVQKIKGANIDIDFSKIPGMTWEPGKCPWGKEHKCAVKNVSICDYFGGVEAPDTIICKYKK